MSEDAFDAIIVGAGLAGCVAALVLARAGANVLVIERGNYAGAKNVTGGRLYAHTLERIIPGFAEQAPVERRITHEKISFLTADSAVTLDYHNARDGAAEAASYSVLRGKFDTWLMEQAEAAGAQFIPGIRVDRLIQRDGRVVGVEADGDELEANVVILAEGVNALLAEQIGMVQPRVEAKNVAVGVKELIELPRELLEARFALQGNDGTAWLFAGTPSDGLMGGGFLYTNGDSLSLGIVCGLHHIEQAGKSIPQMLEDFKQHPTVRPLIEGGKTVEYAAHVVPEAGINMQPKLVADGVLLAGDAAGMCLNLGFTIRGMDLAIASGEAAARAVLAAREKNDFSAAGLAEYPRLLESLPVMKELRHYRKVPQMMDNPRMFTQYPQLAADIMSALFTVDGRPPQPLRKTLLQHCKQVGYLNLLKDGIKGVTAL
ncbi:FAD-dependent oxidoreductase [Edwardsiella piscicida]|nr:FAD-dependent oxidoreductase FixC [Edwardsiella piscicida]AGH74684.1 electron transfer flavoprotein-quinone oxidoreductase FixC [Edwardsiella piscicida C07-087]ARD19076.1 oxidoreductase [Edwardsiella piscicida]EKS7779543.1 FAD-dependent oxidoreductase [Edwardsiella piscicida]EKS7782964.1 FAD-dependent oxidoreductase [Edwardsiella piscicida]EKS7793084.1 FAD-dependent oxidoreductase [Edwardsiella piscicida]